MLVFFLKKKNIILIYFNMKNKNNPNYISKHIILY